MPERRYHIALAVWAALVLAFTLPPIGDASARASLCLLCGQRGLADALLNGALFLPLGVVLSLRGRSLPIALVSALIISLGIETTQLAIPGRHSTLGDLASNTLGAVIGASVVLTRRVWLRPDRRTAAVLGGGALITAAMLFGASAYLLEPSLPSSTYFGQWTPRLGHLAWYRGDVLEFEIGPLSIPPRRLASSDSVRALLRAGGRIRVRALAGPPTQRLGSLVSIYDDEQREIVLVGPDRQDLVYRLRTRAAAARLDQPDIRLRDAFAGVEPGRVLRVKVEKRATSHCLELNDRRQCGSGFRLSQGWGLLYHAGHLPPWLATLVGLAWLASIVAPVGFWLPGTRALLSGGAVLLAVLYAMTATSSAVLVAAPLELAAVMAGLAAGGLVRRMVKARGQREGERASAN